MSTTPTNPPPFSDANIHRQRTTFPHDLRVLSNLLSSLPHPIPLYPQAGPQEHDIQRDLPEMINDMFSIILYDYDVRNPTDWEEMKDTAGLSEEHFLGIRKRLYPDHQPFVEYDNEDELEWMLDELCGCVNVIEGTRDHGLPLPTYGLGDQVVLRDGRDSPVSVAYSDDIEFFTGGRAVEEEGKDVGEGWAGKEEGDEYAGVGKRKADEHAGGGNEETDEQASAGKEEK